MEYLGIGSVEIANQIVQRDRHSEFVMWVANTVTTLDKICTAVRNLQRSEIAEISEGFGKVGRILDDAAQAKSDQIRAGVRTCTDRPGDG